MTGNNVNDETFWQRPVGPAQEVAAPVPGSGETQHEAEYAGPPRTVPPPPGWRLPRVAQLPPARTLPVQDTALLDAEDQMARTFTYGIAMVAGAIMVVLLLLIGGRVLF
jgi:hypothetical protein